METSYSKKLIGEEKKKIKVRKPKGRQALKIENRTQ